MVEIDAKSLAALDTWPWSRRYHAAVLDRLGAAGASMVAFDVDFSARSDRTGDDAFAAALRRVQPVILPIFQQRASDDPAQRQMIKSRPAARFDGAWVGGVNILPGRDGVVRDFPAATMIGGRIQPAMAVLLAEQDGLGDRTFLPDWSINAGKIPRFSFIDVLEGRVPPRALAGKRVIIGATAIELGDRYTIPRYGTVAGVIIQALATESLIQHRTISRSGSLLSLIGLAAIALLFAGRFRRTRRTFPLAAATVLTLLAIVPVAIQARWPVSIDTAPLLVCAVAVIVLRLIVEARHVARLHLLRDLETGLPNQRALQLVLDELAEPTLTVTAAAIERFEHIRSAIGWEGLADTIKVASLRIGNAVHGEVFRVAPDALAWISPAEDDPEQLAALVNDQFVAPVVAGSGAIDVRWTFGLASTTQGAASTSLVEQALAAINTARAGGRSREWFRGIAPATLRDLSIMGELRRGIEDGQVFVAYQPKLHLESGFINHAEALVRWMHPSEGLIPPDRFVPLAEETGVVRELTRFVIGRVIADHRQLSSTNDFAISVNVSAADIDQADFADMVIEALAESTLDPSCLTLEITESAIISSQEAAIDVLHTLRERGIRLSIDDYGTGQSTLSYLKKLPVNELKIDKSFVTTICANENDRIMVRSTIDLAHELGLTVVAEGVENRETLKLLAQFGCDYAQGFLIGRAIPFEQLCSMSGQGSLLRKVA